MYTSICPHPSKKKKKGVGGGERKKKEKKRNGRGQGGRERARACLFLCQSLLLTEWNEYINSSFKHRHEKDWWAKACGHSMLYVKIHSQALSAPVLSRDYVIFISNFIRSQGWRWLIALHQPQLIGYRQSKTLWPSLSCTLSLSLQNVLRYSFCFHQERHLPLIPH